MTDIEKLGGPSRSIFLFLAIVGILIIFLGIFILEFFGSAGITLLNLSISGILTAALVYLYFQQTTILDSQRELFTQQLNREARQHHTETLRQVVEKWHGNPTRQPPEDLTQAPVKNLPEVYGASVKSAQNIGITVGGIGREKEFHSVPRELRDDPYFVDLLEYHARDLRDTKERIDELVKKFRNLRDQFETDYDEGLTVEKSDYLITPGQYLAKWVFELIVLLERGRLDDFDDLVDRAFDDIERSDASPYDIDESSIRILANTLDRAFTVNRAEFDDADHDELKDYREEVEAEARGVIRDVLNQIGDNEPYSTAREAGDILADVAEEIDKLDELLIEYYGRPTYGGDCKYLQEARIG